MLATFVALTKSGHAYIPIDSHSALERVSAILEVAEPSLIIAISEFPLEQVSTPMMTLAQVQEAFAQGTSYEITHPVKGDDNYYIILLLVRLVSLKECRFPMITSSALPTG